MPVLLNTFISIGSVTISEELLKLQGSISSVKRACESSQIDRESQKVIQTFMDCKLSDSYSTAWAARNAKVEARARNERLSQENKALLKTVKELQRKGIPYPPENKPPLFQQ